ncbi:LacI family DNA-binding transcriptional regulator [Intrasporangium sp. YIM S08009]|uniref:LacI family DNA-binding transcriptional regulator n=1 Tax=Intrasporangium zincisolvens TaxID=3080018 RepID=UPI002B05BE30|nr:LacI family DNA-binding transcriptional regulator [Intrasporangium sp. YIM S08009]
MATGRVTMEDVAARAGVSRALVSIVFRGVAGASDETRARVLAAASDLDYRPDTRASRLGRGRTRMLGVTFAVGHAFHGEVLRSLYTEADAVGYEVVLSGVTPDRSDTDAVDTLLAERCEGLVLVGSDLATGAMARLAERLPVVSVLRPARRASGVGVVRTDDALGMRLAVEHLRGLGHERIGLLDGGRAPGAAERRQGYRRGMRSAPGLHALVMPGGLTELDGAAAARAFLAMNAPRPTGVVAFNDRCALGFVDVVRQAGVRVPQDVSVVGFDDIEQAGYPHVALTTVRQDAARLGAEAVRTVTGQLDDAGAVEAAEPTGAVIEPELVVRSSTAPPSAGRVAAPPKS